MVDTGDFGGESLVVIVGKSRHGSVILIERIVISFAEDREKFVTLSDDDEWNLCVERGGRYSWDFTWESCVKFGL